MDYSNNQPTNIAGYFCEYCGLGDTHGLDYTQERFLKKEEIDEHLTNDNECSNIHKERIKPYSERIKDYTKRIREYTQLIDGYIGRIENQKAK